MQEKVDRPLTAVDLKVSSYWNLDNIDYLITAAGFVVDSRSREIMTNFIKYQIPEVRVWAVMSSVIFGVLHDGGCKKLPSSSI